MLRYMLLPFLLFSLIITAIYSLTILREGGRDHRGSDVSSKPASVSRMHGVRIINTRDSKRQWTLRSPSIEIEGDRVRILAVDADILGIEMELKASRGTYDMNTGDLDLDGGVNMIGDKYSIITHKALLEPSRERFLSEGDVVIEGRNFRISGIGLIAERQEIKVLSDVRAVFY